MNQKDNINKVNLLDDIYLPHPNIDGAIQDIKFCIEISKSSKEPFCMSLTGEPGTGKTTACQTIINMKKFIRRVENRENRVSTIVPAFYTSVPSPVTIKGIASAMLASLGSADPTKGGALELTFRLEKLLKECETKVIILDEIQNLIRNNSTNENSHIKNWLKSLINDFKVPLIVVGTPECETIIETDNQLARRFSKRRRLTNFQLDSESNEFLGFLMGLVGAIKGLVQVDIEIDFEKDLNYLIMYAVTGGNPADTMKVMKMSLLNALNNDKSVVTIDDLENAYKDLFFPNSLPLTIPIFQSTKNNLDRAIQGYLRKFNARASG